MTTATRARCVAGAALAVALAVAAPPAQAQSRPQLSIELTPASVSFPWASPDTSPVLVAPLMTVKYRVHWKGTGYRVMTLQANGDLESGAAAIPITNLSWTATPSPPMVGGTMSKTTAQLLATSNDDQIGFRYGCITFRLVNSWSYPVGTYTQSIVFTLSTP